MIISFSGRKGCGKTLLANHLISCGFEKISIASPLKNIASQLYNLPLDDFYDPIKKEKEFLKPLKWNKSKCNELSILVGIELEYENGQEFKNIREMLQYIGTDVIRKHDPDFHIRETCKSIKKDGNYVLDDVRFPNELKVMKQHNAICIYVIRPWHFEYSNHKSETALLRSQFKYVILNERTKKYCINALNQFLRNFNERPKNRPTRQFVVNLLEQTGGDTIEAAKNWKCSRDKVEWWAKRYLIHVRRNKYYHNENAFLNYSPEAAYWAGLITADGCIKKHLNSYLLEFSNTDKELVDGFREFLKTNKPIHLCDKNGFSGGDAKQGYSLTLACPWLIDDLKLWNINPRKTLNESLPPEEVTGNLDLFSQWIVGFIDGDGTICVTTKNKGLLIQILGTEQIVRPIKEYFNIPCSNLRQETGNNGNKIPLYKIIYSGKNAVALYQKIYKDRGLSRKWDKVVPYLNKIWHH